MKRLIDRIADILYPRAPGEPDRASTFDKVVGLLILGAFLGLMFVAARVK